MKTRKTRLCMAVASTIAAAALAPTASWGFSINAADGTWSSDSGGDTLIYPIYTTGNNGGSTSSFSLTNTSDTKVVITKIRFREQLRSMDAMDFLIVLSPNDKFDFTLSKTPGNRPVMGWDDNSCIVGPQAGDTSYRFPVTNAEGGNNNSYVYDETALDAGHIEVLSMAALQPSDNICYNPTNQTVIGGTACATGEVNLATAATHVNGVTPDCASVRTVLKSSGLTNQLRAALATSADAGGNAPNSLVGRYVVTVPGGGIEGGGDAMAIQNSDLPLSSQSQDYCDATNNCTSAYNWDTRDYDHPHLGDMPAGYLANFEAGLQAANVAGEWSNNPGNSVGVDWVMSFPTKYLYEDVGLPPDLTGLYPVEGWPNFVMLAQTPREGLANPWPVNLANKQQQFCLSTDPKAWGIEEESGTNQEVVSPSPTTTLEFCSELNVLTFSINNQAVEPSYLATNDANGASRRTVVSFAVSSAGPVYRGWSKLGLNWYTGNGALPGAVEGIIYTVRDTDQAAINNGSLTELQKNVGMSD